MQPVRPLSARGPDLGEAVRQNGAAKNQSLVEPNPVVRQERAAVSLYVFLARHWHGERMGRGHLPGPALRFPYRPALPFPAIQLKAAGARLSWTERTVGTLLHDRSAKVLWEPKGVRRGSEIAKLGESGESGFVLHLIR